MINRTSESLLQTMQKKHTNNILKLRSIHSTFDENSSMKAVKQLILFFFFLNNYLFNFPKTKLNALSFRRIIHPRPPPTTPRTEQSSFIIVNSLDNDHANDLLTRSILIDSATRQRGFLPYDYRVANTFEAIRRQRSNIKPVTKMSATNPRIFNRTSTHSDVFGNLTSSMSKLAEQRLILREKSVLNRHNTSPAVDRHEKSFFAMTDADFANDIPNALELLEQNTNKKSTMEQYLFETMKRERLQQARYRLLPINRAPYY